jgi:hypothetical protein
LICWAVSDSSGSGCSDDIVGPFLNSMALLGGTALLSSGPLGERFRGRC